MRPSSILIVLFLLSNSWPEGDVPADQLLSVLEHGTQATQKLFKTDNGEQATIEIYGLQSNEYALFWESDMDIDCDGEPDDICNYNTDPWFYPAVSADIEVYASQTPFYVVPNTFDNYVQGVEHGSVAAVIYEGEVVYGPLLDMCGVADVIGEASYAMAEYLGIDPDPLTGGTEGPVYYIAFTGASAQLVEDDYTDHAKAIELGNERAKELVEYFQVTGNNNHKPAISPIKTLQDVYKITLPEIMVTAQGNHTVTVTNFKGQQVMTWRGEGTQLYSLPDLSAGLYIIKIVTPNTSATERAIMY